MARKKKTSKKHCSGLKRNGRLKKGHKWKRGHACPVKSKKS